MSDDLVMRLNALADARHDDLDVAAEASQRIISVTLQLVETQERIAELERGYADAIKDIECFAAYAGDYFQRKHDLVGCIASHNRTLYPPDEAQEQSYE